MRLQNIPSKMAAKWRSAVRARIAGAAQTATVYYHRELETTGAGVDRFLGESLDGRDPYAEDGLIVSGGMEYSTQESFTVSGYYFTGLSGGTSIRDKDVLQNLGIGELNPGDVIMVAEAAGIANSKFYNVHYAELSGITDRKYRLAGVQPYGMLGVQFWRLLLKESQVGDEEP